MDNVIAAIRNTPGGRFVSFQYRNKEGWLKQYTLQVNYSVANLYQEDLAAVEADIAAGKYPEGTLEREAAEEVAASLRTSLEKGIGQRDDYAGKEVFDYLGNGITVHRDTEEKYVSGLIVNTVVMEEGTPKKVVNSRPLTLAKNKVKAGFKSGRIVKFKLSSLQSARLNGETLELS